MSNLNTILDEDFVPDETRKKRPVILLVLCILTWAGCAAYIGFWSYIWLEVDREFYREMGEHIFNYIYLNIGGALLCALGAVLMFLRKQSGFVVYLAGQIPP